MVIFLTILAVGILCISCFVVGAKVGQTVSMGEKIQVPNPIKAIKEQAEKKEEGIKRERIDAIIENINNYDGTSIGQKEVPRR